MARWPPSRPGSTAGSSSSSSMKTAQQAAASKLHINWKRSALHWVKLFFVLWECSNSSDSSSRKAAGTELQVRTRSVPLAAAVTVRLTSTSSCNAPFPANALKNRSCRLHSAAARRQPRFLSDVKMPASRPLHATQRLSPPPPKLVTSWNQPAGRYSIWPACSSTCSNTQSATHHDHSCSMHKPVD
jgi:hypothetical protein